MEENIYTTSEILSDEDLAILTSVMGSNLAQANAENAESTSETPVENIIPENSKTILMNEFTSRFTSAIWYNKIRTLRVTLAGLGGIGSYIGFLLSRLQVGYLSLYDPDIVEAVNISGQMYPTLSIGNYKTSALADLIRNFSDFYNYRTLTQRYEEFCPTNPIMICGFDNMEARKVFFNNWLKHVRSTSHPEMCLFIDGRIEC